jgi:hypothetical protein
MQGFLKFVRSIFSFGVVVGFFATLAGIFTWTGATFVIGLVYTIVCLMFAALLDRFIRT